MRRIADVPRVSQWFKFGSREGKVTMMIELNDEDVVEDTEVDVYEAEEPTLRMTREQLDTLLVVSE